MKIKSSNIQKKTDEEIMLLVADRNMEAFKALYRRYEAAIFNFILRYTGNRELSRELLQETFTRIWYEPDYDRISEY